MAGLLCSEGKQRKSEPVIEGNAEPLRGGEILKEGREGKLLEVLRIKNFKKWKKGGKPYSRIYWNIHKQ